MDRKSVIWAAVMVMAALLCPAAAAEPELEGSITVSGAWAMYPTVVAWGEAFQKAHPKVKIDISAGGAGKGAADAIAGLADIGMVSREPDPAELQRPIRAVYVLHDAVFPVVSAKNPALPALAKKGVRKEAWIWLYISGMATKWDEVAGERIGKPVHLYTRSDSCGAAASWAAYMGKKQEDLKGVGVYGDPGLLEAAKRDPLGVGYTNFSYIFTREGKIVEGAAIVPIDANNNGVADPHEVYPDRDAAVKAIEDGSYPATRKNYFFINKTAGPLAAAFVRFALSDEGTRIVNEVGTSLPVPGQERARSLHALE